MSLSRFEDELRRAGVDDAPSAERRSALRARVLEAAAFGATAAASVADAATASPKTTPIAAGQTLTAKSGLLAKIFVMAASALVAGGAVVVMIASQGSRPSSERSQEDAMATASPSPIVVTPEEPSADTPPSVAVSALPNASSPAPVRVQGQTSDDVAAEAALLEAARLCVERDDRVCADASLAEHARRFPRGALLDEAEVLRIELARRGQGDARARALAEQFLQKNPSSPYAKRVRRLLDDLDGGRP